MSSATYSPGPERAPSELSVDQASFARTVGLTGLFSVVLGVLILILNWTSAKLPFQIGNNVAFAAIVIGMGMMYFHAARDSDQLIRRLYGYVGGYGLILAGLILSILPLIISGLRSTPAGETKQITSLFFPFGWACFLAALLFLIPFLRNETEEKPRGLAVKTMGYAALFFALLCFFGGMFVQRFALTYGTVCGLLGLAYGCAHIVHRGGADRDGYWPAMLLGGLGLFGFLTALIRSCLPNSHQFFVPTGLAIMGIGLLYLLLATFLVGERPLLAMTRRELMAYFYSPVGYLVMLMTALVAGFMYIDFYANLLRPSPEPIVLGYLGNLVSIFTVTFLVPAITMRLVSEEKRSGTYEVLMAAPVSETSVVLSKLFAAFIFFLLNWTIWAVYLLALRSDQEKVFEFRPILSYYLAVAATGLNFLAMGVFFSSLTRNQIIAAVLTFAGMMFWIIVFYASRSLPPTSAWSTVCHHLTYINLWWESLSGKLSLRDVIIHLSLAVFWIYLSVKALEIRRWS
jgi:ABC-2 type transport system permease protein